MVGNTLIHREFTSSYIASFFRNIGFADQLGSGVRNLFKYSKFYSGQEPQFLEGDVFQIIVPLNDAYSYDFGQIGQSDQTDQSDQTELNVEMQAVLNSLREHPDMTTVAIANTLGWGNSKEKYYLQKLKKKQLIKRHGTNRNGYWGIL